MRVEWDELRGERDCGSGKQLGTAALEVGSGSTAIAQARSMDLALAAVANGADTVVFAGAVDLYRCSLTAGCVWRNTTNAVNGCAAPAMVAPAEHAIAVLAGAGTGALPLIYVGNDGGVWRSVDGVNQLQTPCSTEDGTQFQNLNGGLGSLAEVVSLAQDPVIAGTLLVGLGANGTAATGAAATAGAWPQISAGEGGAVAIDPANPANWYVSQAAGVNVRSCGKGSGCAAADFAGAPTIGVAQVANDASLIDAPFLLDPALTTDVLDWDVQGVAWGGRERGGVAGGEYDQRNSGCGREWDLWRDEWDGAVDGRGRAGERGGGGAECGIDGAVCGDGGRAGRRRELRRACVRELFGRECGREHGVDGCGEVDGDERCRGCGEVQSGRV